MAYCHPHPGSGPPGRPEDLYTSPPPWDIGRPQPAFLDLARAGLIRGRVLDVGCGTGEHTLMAAGLGLDATGIDLAASALDNARRKARERGRAARGSQRAGLFCCCMLTSRRTRPAFPDVPGGPGSRHPVADGWSYWLWPTLTYCYAMLDRGNFLLFDLRCWREPT
jgi:SAM-dependent methyltransferase